MGEANMKKMQKMRLLPALLPRVGCIFSNASVTGVFLPWEKSENLEKN
jgi:hypothetical protein